MARVKLGRLSGAARKRFTDAVIRPLVDQPRLSAQIVEMRPGARTPRLHHARTTEFFLVLSGTQTARIGRRRLRLTAGDFAILPPGVPHEFQAGRNGTRVLAVFSPALNLRRPDVVRG